MTWVLGELEIEIVLKQWKPTVALISPPLRSAGGSSCSTWCCRLTAGSKWATSCPVERLRRRCRVPQWRSLRLGSQGAAAGGGGIQKLATPGRMDVFIAKMSRFSYFWSRNGRINLVICKGFSTTCNFEGQEQEDNIDWPIVHTKCIIFIWPILSRVHTSTNAHTNAHPTLYTSLFGGVHISRVETNQFAQRPRSWSFNHHNASFGNPINETYTSTVNGSRKLLDRKLVWELAIWPEAHETERSSIRS